MREVGSTAVWKYSSIAVQQYSSEALVRQYSRNTKKEMDGCYIFFRGRGGGGGKKERGFRRTRQIMWISKQTAMEVSFSNSGYLHYFCSK